MRDVQRGWGRGAESRRHRGYKSYDSKETTSTDEYPGEKEGRKAKVSRRDGGREREIYI